MVGADVRKPTKVGLMKWIFIQIFRLKFSVFRLFYLSIQLRKKYRKSEIYKSVHITLNPQH
jgi:hypothetical protein